MGNSQHLNRRHHRTIAHNLHRIANPYLVYDSFIDTDNVGIEAHIPDRDSKRDGWSVVQGAAANFKISSNKLLIALNTTVAPFWSLAVIDSGQADCVITGSIILAGANPALMFRATDSDNMWIVNFGIAATQLRLIKRDATVQTTEAFTVHAYGIGNVISFEIILRGNNIVVKDLTNGISVSDIDAFNNTVTTHGCGENNGASLVTIDDFTINRLE